MTGTTHFSVAILSASQEDRVMIAKSWGKKGTESDITLFSIAKPQYQTTILPTRYPEKPIPLVVAAHMAHVLVLAVPIAGIDAFVGETAILADILKMPGIRTVVGKSVAGYESLQDQMDKIFASLEVKHYVKAMTDEASVGKLREAVLQIIPPLGPSVADDELVIEADHTFPVQGVGAVILGNVKSGTVQKGQKIIIYPGGHKGVVKSIQVHDVDVREAGPRTHVGIALRGILEKNIDRGSVVTTEDSSVLEVTEITDMLFYPAAFSKPVAVGTPLHAIIGLANTPCELMKWEKEGEFVKVSLKLSKPMSLYKNARVTLINLNEKQRILASRKL